MIRPFTLICMASAFGAGLYLYQSKHTAQMLDREISRTIKQTEVVRDRTGMLKAEWALLNEPDRLADLARAHLTLQTLKPTQFVAMNDLSSRLPAPVAPHPERPVEPEPEAPAAVPVAQAAPVPAPVPAVTPVTVAPVAVAVVAKPKVDAKPEAKVAEVKPAMREKVVGEKAVAEKAGAEKAGAEKAGGEKSAAERAFVRAEPVRPVEANAMPVHARVFAGTNEATAPGTVGAAVLRAMRAQDHNAPPVAVSARAYAPPAYAQPAYAQPAYAPPAYAQPGYAPSGYAQPGTSVLGGHPALPPPVPFAAR